MRSGFLLRSTLGDKALQAVAALWGLPAHRASRVLRKEEEMGVDSAITQYIHHASPAAPLKMYIIDGIFFRAVLSLDSN